MRETQVEEAGEEMGWAPQRLHGTSLACVKPRITNTWASYSGEGQGGGLVESCTILSCWEVEKVEGMMSLTHVVKKKNLI